MLCYASIITTDTEINFIGKLSTNFGILLFIFISNRIPYLLHTQIKLLLLLVLNNFLRRLLKTLTVETMIQKHQV